MTTAPHRVRALVAHRPRLTPGASFVLLASIVTGMVAASSAPTPLYPRYQMEWGFSAITTTIVFGVYAIAVLVALLVVGSLSDHVGRRPVLLSALVVQAATMWVFATAGSVPQLMAGRMLQGLATGAAIGAVGAGLIDLNRPKGTLANGVVPVVGTAIGAPISGLFVQYLPAPGALVFVAFSALYLLQAVGVLLMPETTRRRPGAIASLRPDVSVPHAARRPMLIAAPVLVAAWALGGFYLALGPALSRTTVHSGSPLVAGAVVFILAGSAAVAVLLARNVAARAMMSAGAAALIGGVAVSVAAIATSSAPLFLLSLPVAGVGFGLTLQGAIRTVLPFAAEHQRAGLLSVVYVVSYLGLGLPAVLAGILVVYGGGLRVTAIEYGLAVIALAGTALVALRPWRVRAGLVGPAA
jgi:predicted MFS family arabinose efflux permease